MTPLDPKDIKLMLRPATGATYVDKTGTDQKLNPMRDVYLEFPYAMQAVAAVTAYGAGKHAPRGWRTFDHAYALGYHLSKIGRHLLGLETHGQVNYEDGKNLHMAQVAWNALAYLDHLIRLRPELLDELKDPVLEIKSGETISEDLPFARERSET